MTAPFKSAVPQKPEIEAGTENLARKVFVLENLVARLAHAQPDKAAAPDREADAEDLEETVPDSYDPAAMLNRVRKQLGLVSDRHLTLLCDIPFNRFRRIKERKLPMSPTLLLRLHELTGIDAHALRAWMGDTRDLFQRNAIIAEIRPLKTRRKRRATKTELSTEVESASGVSKPAAH